MHIDVMLEPDQSPSQLAELAVMAEGYGLRALYEQNYVSARDPFMALVPAAQATRKIQLGVCLISPYEMHPMRIGNALLTLNEFCHGRAEIVIGGGGFWVSRMGVEPERMVVAIREAIEIVKGDPNGEPMNYNGQMYKAWTYNRDWAADRAPVVCAGANRKQMLEMSTRVADGVMFSDIIRPLVDEAVATLRSGLAKNGRPESEFMINSAIAFHMKEDRETSMREGRRELITRAILGEWYLRSFLDDDEVALVQDNIQSFYNAYRAKSHVIEGVPDEILDKLVYNLSVAGGPDDLDARIEEMQDYAKTGVTQICFRTHGDPANAIRLIGEKFAPAL
jgi:alkanesulfonate monooxygenase SsuD/methylene tetrahydromethanopterin reductase-like flavin-dependent oxidoreductase (luciferase family)